MLEDGTWADPPDTRRGRGQRERGVDASHGRSEGMLEPPVSRAGLDASAVLPDVAAPPAAADQRPLGGTTGGQTRQVLGTLSVNCLHHDARGRARLVSNPPTGLLATVPTATGADSPAVTPRLRPLGNEVGEGNALPSPEGEYYTPPSGQAVWRLPDDTHSQMPRSEVGQGVPPAPPRPSNSTYLFRGGGHPLGEERAPNGRAALSSGPLATLLSPIPVAGAVGEAEACAPTLLGNSGGMGNRPVAALLEGSGRSSALLGLDRTGERSLVGLSSRCVQGHGETSGLPTPPAGLSLGQTVHPLSLTSTCMGVNLPNGESTQVAQGTHAQSGLGVFSGSAPASTSNPRVEELVDLDWHYRRQMPHMHANPTFTTATTPHFPWAYAEGSFSKDQINQIRKWGALHESGLAFASLTGRTTLAIGEGERPTWCLYQGRGTVPRMVLSPSGRAFDMLHMEYVGGRAESSMYRPAGLDAAEPGAHAPPPADQGDPRREPAAGVIPNFNQGSLEALEAQLQALTFRSLAASHKRKMAIIANRRATQPAQGWQTAATAFDEGGKSSSSSSIEEWDSLAPYSSPGYLYARQHMSLNQPLVLDSKDQVMMPVVDIMAPAVYPGFPQPVDNTLYFDLLSDSQLFVGKD